MKLCTTTVVTGFDGKQRFAVMSLGQAGWPMALCGPADGVNAKQNEAEAKFFAAAPVMNDMLESLVDSFGNVDFSKPLSAEQVTLMADLVERAASLVKKHRSV